MDTPPEGWLRCNGADVSRTTYAALFAAIGTRFGSANGSTFRLPDLRGEFIRGWDNGRGLDPGRSFGSMQDDAIRAPFNIGRIISSQFAWTGGTLHGEGYMKASEGGAGISSGPETRPHNLALLACIKL
ncbi:tail fiber protein [Stenotrophomonas maltophilia]|nr:tail fiber protein [Stenotrophomonas maltophilia]